MSILHDRFESAAQRLTSRLRQIQLADPSPSVAQQVCGTLQVTPTHFHYSCGLKSL